MIESNSSNTKKPMKRIYLLFLAVILLTGITFTACSTSEELPNIVVILVDDMGYGDPGCFNPESKIPTPTINQLASGVRWDAFYRCSCRRCTLPSFTLWIDDRSVSIPNRCINLA